MGKDLLFISPDKDYIMLSIEKIEGVIWDMDGVLHSYLPFSQSLDHWNGAAARAFNKVATSFGILHNLTDEQLHEMAVTSFKTLGLSTAIFSREYGISEQDMHLEFHREAVMEYLIASHATLPDHLEQTSHLRHIVLTHGSQEWAERCLGKHGLRDFFQEVISFEQVGMHKKSDSERPFMHAMEKAGLSANQLVMVEDTKKNLIIPKKMGMQTVFIEESGLEPEWVKLPTAEDLYVDHRSKNAMELLVQLTPVS